MAAGGTNTLGNAMDIMLLALVGERHPQPLIQTPFREGNAEISPDGRYLAYQSNESGRDEIFVVPFPNVNAGKWRCRRAAESSHCGRTTAGNSSTCRWTR